MRSSLQMEELISPLDVTITENYGKSGAGDSDSDTGSLNIPGTLRMTQMLKDAPNYKSLSGVVCCCKI